MFDFVRALTVPSAVTYAAWRLRQRPGPVTLMARPDLRFELRPPGSGNGDYGIAYEIFVLRFYDMPGAEAGLVVDLGMNVGFSVLHWLGSFPKCRVIAFEPHPMHFKQARHNIGLNGWLDRVEFHQAAAGARSRSMQLSDQGSSSMLGEHGVGSITVDVIDVFPLLSGRRIDILKIDIEGGEYEIMEDPRFDDLDIRELVMEWHSRGGDAADRRWCVERLQKLGFTITDIFDAGSHGMFRAHRVGAAA
jgi:FkbM family methyltransferase